MSLQCPLLIESNLGKTNGPEKHHRLPRGESQPCLRGTTGVQQTAGRLPTAAINAAYLHALILIQWSILKPLQCLNVQKTHAFYLPRSSITLPTEWKQAVWGAVPLRLLSSTSDWQHPRTAKHTCSAIFSLARLAWGGRVSPSNHECKVCRWDVERVTCWCNQVREEGPIKTELSGPCRTYGFDLLDAFL